MEIPRLVIIEGPDCSGKSTFARSLPGVYIHGTWLKESTPANALHYYTSLLEIVKTNLDKGYSVVMDRGWPSEACYGPVFRKDVPSPLNTIKSITESLNPVYVFCVREDIEAAHAVNRSPSHPYPKREFSRVVRNYKLLLEDMQGDFFLKPRTFVKEFDKPFTF